jgi:hypothetical protein
MLDAAAQPVTCDTPSLWQRPNCIGLLNFSRFHFSSSKTLKSLGSAVAAAAAASSSSSSSLPDAAGICSIMILGHITGLSLTLNCESYSQESCSMTLSPCFAILT